MLPWDMKIAKCDVCSKMAAVACFHETSQRSNSLHGVGVRCTGVVSRQSDSHRPLSNQGNAGQQPTMQSCQICFHNLNWLVISPFQLKIWWLPKWYVGLNLHKLMKNKSTFGIRELMSLSSLSPPGSLMSLCYWGASLSLLRIWSVLAFSFNHLEKAYSFS